VSSCGAGAAKAPRPRARKTATDESFMMGVEKDEELVEFAKLFGVGTRRSPASPMSMEPYMCL
jgi:hypothetical protein